MTKKVDLHIEQEVIRLYTTMTDNGWMGGKTISKILSIATPTVQNILHRNGIKTRNYKEAQAFGKHCKPITNLPVGSAPLCKCGCGNFTKWNQRKNGWNVFIKGHYRKDLPYKNRDWLFEQYHNGRTLQEIAKQFNVCPATIKKFAKKFNLILRTHSETLKLRGSTKGNRNPAWKGGVTPDRQRIYKTDEWIKLVRYIYERDNYKCQRCGVAHNRQNKLHAHHLKSWAEYPALRIEETNLITLCNSCHLWVHSRKNINSEFIL